MVINIKKLYTVIFAIILLSQLYIESYRVNIFLQLFFAFVLILNEKTISVSFFKIIFPLTLVIILSFFTSFFYNYELKNILKDFFLIIKPLVGISLGYIIFKKINDLAYFVKVIIIIGFISATLHFIILFFTGNIFTGNVSQIREFGKDNFLELFALFFLINYKKVFKQDIFSRKINYKAVLLILIFSCIFYFSRTMLIIATIIILSIYGYTRVTKKAVQVFLLLSFMILMLTIYLINIKIDRNEKGIMGFLYKIKMAPTEVFVSKIDRENHQDLWDHWRAYEANRAMSLMSENPSSYLIGTGLGSLVNLKFLSPLGSEKKGLKYISEIHNGYVFIFYKTGIIGLIILLTFFINLYKKIWAEKGFVSIIISAIGIIYIFTTLTITGVYNKRDIIIILLGSLLYFSTKKEDKIYEIEQ